MKLVVLLLGAFTVAACTVGPDYRRPAVPVPPDFRGAVLGGATSSLGDLTWREMFGDEALQSLIHEALTRNHDVQIAANALAFGAEFRRRRLAFGTDAHGLAVVNPRRQFDAEFAPD